MYLIDFIFLVKSGHFLFRRNYKPLWGNTGLVKLQDQNKG